MNRPYDIFCRDPELKSKWGTICPPIEMLAPDGKLRKTQASDLEGIFCIIESIPSKKSEPVRINLCTPTPIVQNASKILKS